jgi:hypothetical protein
MPEQQSGRVLDSVATLACGNPVRLHLDNGDTYEATVSKTNLATPGKGASSHGLLDYAFWAADGHVEDGPLPNDDLAVFGQWQTGEDPPLEVSVLDPTDEDAENRQVLGKLSKVERVETDGGQTAAENADDLSFADLAENATAGDANASRDSALQYVAIDLLEAGVEDQDEHLSELEESVEDAAATAFRDGVRVAAIGGEQKAAEWAIDQILDDVDTDSAVGKRFAERLCQKEGHIAQAYDAALTEAKRAPERELNEAVVEWTEVV